LLRDRLVKQVGYSSFKHEVLNSKLFPEKSSSP